MLVPVSNCTWGNVSVTFQGWIRFWLKIGLELQFSIEIVLDQFLIWHFWRQHCLDSNYLTRMPTYDQMHVIKSDTMRSFKLYVTLTCYTRQRLSYDRPVYPWNVIIIREISLKALSILQFLFLSHKWLKVILCLLQWNHYGPLFPYRGSRQSMTLAACFMWERLRVRTGHGDAFIHERLFNTFLWSRIHYCD